MSSMVPIPVQNPANYTDSTQCPKCPNDSPFLVLYVPANYNNGNNPEQLMKQCGGCGYNFYQKCKDAPQS